VAAIKRRDRKQIEEGQQQVHPHSIEQHALEDFPGREKGRRRLSHQSDHREQRRGRDEYHQVCCYPRQRHDDVTTAEVAVLPRGYGHRFGSAEGERSIRRDPQDDRKDDRHERIDVFQGIQRQPPEHVGGVVTLPVGRLGVGVFVSHDREQQDRCPDEELERDGVSLGSVTA
jgi:hypothetical protein